MSLQKRDLVKTIAKKTGISQSDTTQVINHFLEEITHALANHGRLELRKFGVFETGQHKARKLKHPSTGKIIHIPAQNIVKFKASSYFKAKINTTKKE